MTALFRTHALDLPYACYALLELEGRTYRVVSILRDGTVTLDDTANPNLQTRRGEKHVDDIARVLASGDGRIIHTGVGAREDALGY